VKEVPQAPTTFRAVRKRKSGKGWKIALIVVAALILLWGVSEIAIPAIASSYIKGRIQKKYPQAKNVSVSVKAFPAIRLAFKDYSSLSVKVSDVTLQGINFQTISLDSTKWPNGSFVATVQPGEIMRFFSSTHSYVLQPQLALNQNLIQVSGKMNLGYATVNLTSTGSLEPRDGKQLYFNPTTVTVTGVNGAARAADYVKQVMASSPVFVIREDLPFTVMAVSVSNGSLEVKGNVDLSKALNMKL
jgi:hypothetical protein